MKSGSIVLMSEEIAGMVRSRQRSACDRLNREARE